MDKTEESISIDDIVKKHGKRLYNLAYRICGDQTYAEDLLQESFIQIQKALPNFHFKSSVYTWAYKITLRTCLGKTRGRNMEQEAKAALARLESSALEKYLPSSEPKPEDVLVQKALIAEIREKCHYFITFILSENQRVAILLNDLFEFSYKDIAYLLDTTEDVIRSRLSRARARLKRHFEKRCSWINPQNPCKCENRAGYVLNKYPSLRKNLSKRTSRPEYNQLIAKQIDKKIVSQDDIIASFPFIDFKAQKTLEAIYKQLK
ncbi:MAG: RNA polymerase sigma factor [Spirochaetales bacterium]|nr:RNA polymerase sigma factor [Spirochaetales bacterium]